MQPLTTESAILETVKRLPEPIKKSALLYVEFLASQYASTTETDETEAVLESEKPALIKPALAGSMKGLFSLPLPDDFDEPLADFDEYM